MGVVLENLLTTVNGQNIYTYCNNNPVNYVDPSGHSAILIGLVIGALIGFGSTVVADYQDDGQVFNGSISFGEYIGATLGGAISGLGTGLGTTILASGLGNVIEAVFTGEISSFDDVLFQFALK